VMAPRKESEAEMMLQTSQAAAPAEAE